MIAWRTCDCVSASDDMARLLGASGLRSPLGACGFSEQGRQCWNIVVPLDQRRFHTEATNCVGVQLPGRIRNGGGVRIDQDVGARTRFIGLGAVPSQMQFANTLAREAVDVFVSVVPHVLRTEVDVADVAEQLTPCSAYDLVQEF